MQLAVFDLDGTITRHDSLVPFVFGFLARNPLRLARIAAGLPAALRFARNRDRGALKAAWIRATLGGVSRERLAQWTGQFVPALLASGTFNHVLDIACDIHRCFGSMTRWARGLLGACG